MKTVDYINTLIKEKEELKALCKSHVETICTMKRELSKLKYDISRKDAKIKNLEGEIKSPNAKLQRELDDTKNELSALKAEYEDLKNKCNTAKTPKVSSKVKNELNTLKAEYEDLKNKYNAVVSENEEFKRIFDDIENMTDSDE